MTDSTLRFLADESCDFAIGRILRANGYDVIAVAEFMQRSVDAVVEPGCSRIIQKPGSA